jgi:hypothetical protein
LADISMKKDVIAIYGSFGNATGIESNVVS